MKKFNSTFCVETTKVQMPGEYGFRRIKEIHETRNWIKVEGYACSFQRGDIIAFTNKDSAEMFPALDDLYMTDQYGSVYERGSDVNMFIGKLNGRTLKKFLRDNHII
tara:strand:+ start:20111 stop:20431 length:321 start_codon:yes stop_codon:yes gene_type:complete